jgi:hypothetical protein
MSKDSRFRLALGIDLEFLEIKLGRWTRFQILAEATTCNKNSGNSITGPHRKKGLSNKIVFEQKSFALELLVFRECEAARCGRDRIVLSTEIRHQQAVAWIHSRSTLVWSSNLGFFLKATTLCIPPRDSISRPIPLEHAARTKTLFLKF